MTLDPFKPYLRLFEGLAAAAIVGGIFWAGWHYGTANLQEKWDLDKSQRIQALADQQTKVIELQNAQRARETQVEADHAKLVADNQRATDSLLGIVRNLEATIRLSPLPGTVDHSCQSGGAPAGAGSAGCVEAAVTGLNEAIAGATSACLKDSAELAGILALAPKE